MAITERRRRDRQRRRAEILAAAAAVFADRGLAGASMDAIAERAELGKATLYYYFRTKEELHGAVIADAAERIFADLAAVERPFSSLADLVQAVLSAYGRFIRANPTLLRVLAPYLEHMHQVVWDPGPHGPSPGISGPDEIPRHHAFVSDYRRLLAASPWARDPEPFTRFLTSAFSALGQLVMQGRGDDVERQVLFTCDLVRCHRADGEGPRR